MPAFQAPPGTFDVLAPASSRYDALTARFADRLERAGYGLVIRPMLEHLRVFPPVGALPARLPRPPHRVLGRASRGRRALRRASPALRRQSAPRPRLQEARMSRRDGRRTGTGRLPL